MNDKTTFKPGDRVRYKRNAPVPHLRGRMGTVLPNDDSSFYMVDFDGAWESKCADAYLVLVERDGQPVPPAMPSLSELADALQYLARLMASGDRYLPADYARAKDLEALAVQLQEFMCPGAHPSVARAAEYEALNWRYAVTIKTSMSGDVTFTLDTLDAVERRFFDEDDSEVRANKDADCVEALPWHEAVEALQDPVRRCISFFDEGGDAVTITRQRAV